MTAWRTHFLPYRVSTADDPAALHTGVLFHILVRCTVKKRGGSICPAFQAFLTRFPSLTKRKFSTGRLVEKVGLRYNFIWIFMDLYNINYEIERRVDYVIH